jgi:hypothetical protein
MNGCNDQRSHRYEWGVNLGNGQMRERTFTGSGGHLGTHYTAENDWHYVHQTATMVIWHVLDHVTTRFSQHFVSSSRWDSDHVAAISAVLRTKRYLLET